MSAALQERTLNAYRMAKRSELLKMILDPILKNRKGVKAVKAVKALSVKEAVGNISARVREKYSLIDTDTIPDDVNYAKIEKYLRSVNIEVTRRMFTSYIKDHLLPGGHDVRNSNFTLYTHDQILYYILVDMFKPILPLVKIKVLFYDVLRPMIYLIGLDATYARLCANILSMINGFENTVVKAVQEDIKTSSHLVSKPTNAVDAVVKSIGSIAYFTQVEALMLAKGAQEFFEQTPENPLN